MALPEHVKRQAMEVVAHKESTEMIRRYSATDVAAFDLFHPRPYGVLTEAVKREAMSAVGSKETAAQIKMMRECGQVFPPTTPSRESQRIAEKISRMHYAGRGLNEIHRAACKDNFGRDDYGK
jgi:hypothetical protein